jgi:hypothetical protein
MASFALPLILVDSKGRPGILYTPVIEDKKERRGSGWLLGTGDRAYGSID